MDKSQPTGPSGYERQFVLYEFRKLGFEKTVLVATGTYYRQGLMKDL